MENSYGCHTEKRGLSLTIKKALFLDRDGIINIDHGYVSQIEKFEFVEGDL